VLFKTLLRRPGSSTQATGQDWNHDSPGPQDDLCAQLTHTSEYHLERLEKLVELRYHKSPEGSDDAALKELVHFASRLPDQDIQRELLLFYLNCPPKVQTFLRSGDLVDSGHYIHRAPPPGQQHS